jgi:hypothetical protein
MSTVDSGWLIYRRKTVMVTFKYFRSAVSVVALVILATPSVAEPAKGGIRKSTDREIQMCVAEIGKRVKYNKAMRVVHMVKEEQKNIAEQQFRINTAIYDGLTDIAVREYNSLCVTRGPIELVKLRID